MKNRLNNDLKSAMKNKDTLRLNTIRFVKKIYTRIRNFHWTQW